METVPQTRPSAASPGYEALRTSAAWLDLSSRGRIIAAGDDRARLLHAMLTNHIQQLQPGEGCYAFFLSAQGRILTDVNVFCRAGHFLLDVEPETRKLVYEHLDKYIIADDVTLEDVTDRSATIDLEGPQAHAFARRLEIPVPDKTWAHIMWEDVVVANVTFTGAPGLRFFASLEQKSRIVEQFQNAGALAAGPEAARVVRLEHFKPRYGDDIFGTTLTQETQQMHAVHFSKGCYLGQEVVERVRSRGLVHRLLVGVEIDSAEIPEHDTPMFHGEENAGKITAAVFSPALGKVVGMAYVRRELAAPGTALTVDNHTAQVRALYAP